MTTDQTFTTKREAMNQLTAALLAAAVILPAIATAQIKTLPGDSLTVTATVDAIERSSRSVTLRKADGSVITIQVPPDVKRFDAIKVGDQLTARYYDNIVLRVKPPGEKDIDTGAASMTPAGGAKPGASAALQRAITATITAIDPNVPSISLKGPNNWTYTSRVADKAALKQVKVGDRLDITWSASVMISMDEAKPK